ncbi:MAG TPA: aminoglycoside phosphotransferase family protein, partial [candidate division Zixibacteria bacterium]|nr:aminoglycoside phosphotransferase family protein [candidate division Zixibacteria bacterium]
PSESKAAENIFIPADPALPGLTAVLNSEEIASALGKQTISAGWDDTSCERFYIRYKPGMNCIAAYRAKAGNQGESDLAIYAKAYTIADFALARQKAQEHRWVGGDAPPVIELPQECALLFVFPNDFALEGLRILTDPKKIQRLLYQWCDWIDETHWRISDRRLTVTPVRYKPERRAVFKCSTRATHRGAGERQAVNVYARVYADDRGASVFDFMNEMTQRLKYNATLATPRALGYLPDRRLLMITELPGAALNDRFSPQSAAERGAQAAEALAVLHTLPPTSAPERSTADLLKELRDCGAELCERRPALASDVRVTIEEIAQRIDGTPDRFHGLVHGDFHLGQLIADSERIGVIDFDRSYTGDQYADLGELLAHEIADPAPALEAYEKHSGRRVQPARLNAWRAFRTLLIAAGAHRRLEPNWREQESAALNECQTLLT